MIGRDCASLSYSKRTAMELPLAFASNMSTTQDPVPNRYLVVYALSLLGGETAHVHTEDIALKCHELFPESFSWTKYPQYPDKDIVRVALTDARKEQYGALVDGRTGQKTGQTARTARRPTLDGWTLTSAGIRWLRKNLDRLTYPEGKATLKQHRQKTLQQLKRVKDHELYSRFLQEGDRFSPSIGEMAELLRCRVDAAPHIWEQRLQSIRRKAEVAEQGDVTRFVDICTEAYETQHV